MAWMWWVFWCRCSTGLALFGEGDSGGGAGGFGEPAAVPVAVVDVSLGCGWRSSGRGADVCLDVGDGDGRAG